ncbi:DUF4148 domain-containing protein [Roseateles sp.]|uniref:DUF4148 domain-containing protein n=1 Tax=Roseateles sp. TaxID=1971397 RepID=UPI0031DC850E
MSKSLSTALFSATLIAAALGAVAMPAAAQSAPTSHPVVTRAQVLADLQIYRESGLAEADRPEGLSFENGRRAQAQARYDALKASPRFAMLVAQYAAQEGKGAKGAANEDVAAR